MSNERKRKTEEKGGGEEREGDEITAVLHSDSDLEGGGWRSTFP